MVDIDTLPHPAHACTLAFWQVGIMHAARTIASACKMIDVLAPCTMLAFCAQAFHSDGSKEKAAEQGSNKACSLLRTLLAERNGHDPGSCEIKKSFLLGMCLSMDLLEFGAVIVPSRSVCSYCAGHKFLVVATMVHPTISTCSTVWRSVYWNAAQ